MAMSKKKKFNAPPEVGDTPHQPNIVFPPRTFGKTKTTSRPFLKSWFTDYSWIHYDETADSAFCHVCIRAYNRGCISDKNLEPRFISEGYTNWKEAIRHGRGFPGHEDSKCHRQAVESMEVLPKTTVDIGESLSADHASEKAVARQALMKILSNVRFLARQALPLRGDKEGERNSNFNQLYLLRAEDNPFLHDWMKRRADKYTSKDIQNEMMKIMALRVLRDIASQIRSADFFTIMVDEATDVSNVSQLVLCIRWVDENLCAHEEFIGLHALDVANANTIVKVIKDVLLRMNISLKRCRGQCYDGCSTMKGEKKGVAKQIKDEEPKALLTHCFTHSLNLAVGDAIKASKIMKNALETTHEITKLIKKSPKRDSKLKDIKTAVETEEENSENTKNISITLLCPTRWTVRAKSLRSIVENFDDLKTLWDWSLDNCSDTEMKARIRGVSVNMRTFDYIYGAFLGELILGHSDNLSKTLQNPKLSAADGRCVADATVKTLKTIRDDNSFDLFWEKVLKHAQRLGVDDPKLPRRRNQPKNLTDYFGYGTAEEVQHATTKDMYRKHYFEAFDMVVNCIEERFEQQDYQTYSLLEQLLLKAANSESYNEELSDVLAFYCGDFDENRLKSQLQTFSSNFPKIEMEDVTFCDIIIYLQKLSPGMKSLLSQVIRLAKLILVSAATNATSERSFSAMRRAKSYLQSTMGQMRLNNIMVLHVHKERTDGLNMVEVANDFVDGCDSRQQHFGHFQETDKRRINIPVKSVSSQTMKVPVKSPTVEKSS